MSEAHVDPLREWPAPSRVGALATVRRPVHGPGGESDFGIRAGSASSDRQAVAVAREALRRQLGLDEIRYLEQVHGTAVHQVGDGPAPVRAPRADAAVCRRPNIAVAVLTADCLPVLLAHRGAACVAAAHAGWRGLAAGVLEATLAAMAVPAAEVTVWLGPAIGPAAFEVGPEVREAFLAAAGSEDRDDVAAAFRAGRGDRWHANLWQLARVRLAAAGVAAVYGGGVDVVADAGRFHSYRRDGAAAGRQATLIWLRDQP